MRHTRRDFLATSASVAASMGCLVAARAGDDAGDRLKAERRDYLSRILYTHQEVDDWFAGKAFEFEKYVGDYLKRYYIGHYNPRGNFFTALAVKDKLVEMLDPKPPAYQPP